MYHVHSAVPADCVMQVCVRAPKYCVVRDDSRPEEAVVSAGRHRVNVCKQEHACFAVHMKPAHCDSVHVETRDWKVGALPFLQMSSLQVLACGMARCRCRYITRVLSLHHISSMLTWIWVTHMQILTQVASNTVQACRHHTLSSHLLHVAYLSHTLWRWFLATPRSVQL